MIDSISPLKNLRASWIKKNSHLNHGLIMSDLLSILNSVSIIKILILGISLKVLGRQKNSNITLQDQMTGWC